MRWGDARRSDNVEDRRGSPLGGAGKLGGGTIVIVLLLSVVLGKNPLEMLGLLEQSGLAGGGATQQAGGPPPGNDPGSDFARAILGDTEDVWTALFAQANGSYTKPVLELYTGRVESACGGATSASGPFYCPGDRKVYLDLSFFDEMRAKLGGGGDFAQAYVIAHEVGHHVQTLLGVSDKIARARQAGKEVRGDNGLLVRQELQADCLAGVWAFHAQQRHQWLDAGDVESALNTATAIGDDRLQKQGQGYVVPESFTHGTSAERVRWFSAGFKSGAIGNCDTFSAAAL
ncbi:MAG: neutral zinc metallopeptidase [Nevskia sp.]